MQTSSILERASQQLAGKRVVTGRGNERDGSSGRRQAANNDDDDIQEYLQTLQKNTAAKKKTSTDGGGNLDVSISTSSNAHVTPRQVRSSKFLKKKQDHENNDDTTKKPSSTRYQKISSTKADLSKTRTLHKTTDLADTDEDETRLRDYMKRLMSGTQGEPTRKQFEQSFDATMPGGTLSETSTVKISPRKHAERLSKSRKPSVETSSSKYDRKDLDKRRHQHKESEKSSARRHSRHSTSRQVTSSVTPEPSTQDDSSDRAPFTLANLKSIDELPAALTAPAAPLDRAPTRHRLLAQTVAGEYPESASSVASVPSGSRPASRSTALPSDIDDDEDDVPPESLAARTPSAADVVATASVTAATSRAESVADDLDDLESRSRAGSRLSRRSRISGDAQTGSGTASEVSMYSDDFETVSDMASRAVTPRASTIRIPLKDDDYSYTEDFTNVGPAYSRPTSARSRLTSAREFDDDDDETTTRTGSRSQRHVPRRTRGLSALSATGQTVISKPIIVRRTPRQSTRRSSSGATSSRSISLSSSASSSSTTTTSRDARRKRRHARRRHSSPPLRHEFAAQTEPVIDYTEVYQFPAHARQNILRKVVDPQAISQLSNHDVVSSLLDTMVKQQLILLKQYMTLNKAYYLSYTEQNVGKGGISSDGKVSSSALSSPYKYTTVEGTRKFIEKKRRQFWKLRQQTHQHDKDKRLLDGLVSRDERESKATKKKPRKQDEKTVIAGDDVPTPLQV